MEVRLRMQLPLATLSEDGWRVIPTAVITRSVIVFLPALASILLTTDVDR